MTLLLLQNFSKLKALRKMCEETAMPNNSFFEKMMKSAFRKVKKMQLSSV